MSRATQQLRKTKRQRKLQKMGHGKGSSRYAQKVKAGNQMYGDGKRCCGHRFGKQGLRAGGAA